MARILVVDDARTILFYVQKVLEPEGHQVELADKPSVALDLVGLHEFDLVLSDVNMPEMSGFTLCRELRKLPGRESMPFLFMSAADATAELDIARSLGAERLLLKPFAIDTLLRAIGVALGQTHAERGPVSVMLVPMLSKAAAEKMTALVTCVDGSLQKRFVLREGKLVFAGSNDTKDVIGQALIRAGVISEQDLLEASATGAPLVSALASLRKLTREQCDRAFVASVRESLLDVFLWESGTAELVPGVVEGAEMPLPVEIPLQGLVAEGERRRGRWAQVGPILPSPDWQIERSGPWPEDFPKDAGDEFLAKQLDRGLSLEDLMLELRGQRFAVGVKLAKLFQAGAIKAVDPVGFTGSASLEPSPEEIERARLELEVSAKMAQATQAPESPPVAASPVPAPPPVAPAPVPPPARDVFADALIRFRAGELDAAREEFLRVLESDPLNELARLRLREVDTAIVERARSRGLADDRRIRLAVPIGSLVGRKLLPIESFLLSRLVERPYSVGELITVAPLPAVEVLGALERLVGEGTLGDEMQPIRLHAHYQTAHETVEELTRAISNREVTFETKKPMSVGSRFVFEIASPDLPMPLQAHGVVTWVMEHGPDSDGKTLFGMTVKYLFDSEQDRQRVELAVETILRSAPREARRRFQRVPTAYRVVEVDNPLKTTYTIRNLSEGGMLLEPDTPELGGETILVGTRVMLRMEAGGAKHGLLGTVVWASGRGKAGKGNIGVEFDDEARPIALDLMRRRITPLMMSILFGA